MQNTDEFYLFIFLFEYTIHNCLFLIITHHSSAYINDKLNNSATQYVDEDSCEVTDQMQSQNII